MTVDSLSQQVLVARTLRGAQDHTEVHQTPLPFQNGKFEQLNRTLQTEWAYRQVFASNDERAAALAPWLDDHNSRRRRSALGGTALISRLQPT